MQLWINLDKTKGESFKVYEVNSESVTPVIFDTKSRRLLVINDVGNGDCDSDPVKPSLKILSSQKRGGYRGVSIDSCRLPTPSLIFFLNT
jgi:hypothetical protein